MSKALVTGSAGTVGRPLCDELRRCGHAVRALDQVPTPDVVGLYDVMDAAREAAVKRVVLASSMMASASASASAPAPASG